MKANTYCKIHSSWNHDRIGSCVVNRPHKARVGHKSYRYAQYRAHEVSVCGSRGQVFFTLYFDHVVTSAIIKQDRLIVTTEDGCVRHYNLATRELVAEIRPTPPTQDGCVAALSMAA